MNSLDNYSPLLKIMSCPAFEQLDKIYPDSPNCRQLTLDPPKLVRQQAVAVVVQESVQNKKIHLINYMTRSCSLNRIS